MHLPGSHSTLMEAGSGKRLRYNKRGGGGRERENMQAYVHVSTCMHWCVHNRLQSAALTDCAVTGGFKEHRLRAVHVGQLYSDCFLC